MSDRMAPVALEVIAGRGLVVRGDISIGGVDDIPDASRSAPALTPVWQPHSEKGRLLGNAVIARMRGDVLPLKLTLPTSLIVRGSTGAAAS